MKIILGLFLCLGLVGSGFGQVRKTVLDKSLLDSVKSIYVSELPKDNKSTLIREKLIFFLKKSSRFKASETPGEADALLMGTAAVENAGYGRIVNPETNKVSSNKNISRHGVGSFQLIDAKTKKVIWAFDFKGLGADSANNPTGKIAFQTIKRLSEDAGITN